MSPTCGSQVSLVVPIYINASCVSSCQNRCELSHLEWRVCSMCWSMAEVQQPGSSDVGWTVAEALDSSQQLGHVYWWAAAGAQLVVASVCSSYLWATSGVCAALLGCGHRCSWQLGHLLLLRQCSPNSNPTTQFTQPISKVFPVIVFPAISRWDETG